MPIKITINGECATPSRGKDELERMLACGVMKGLTRSVLDAVIAEMPIDHELPVSENSNAANQFPTGRINRRPGDYHIQGRARAATISRKLKQL